MEPASEQFRASDVTLWGIIALACGAFAIVSTNVGTMLPANLVMSLHSSRIEGAGIEQMSAQLARIETESRRISLDNQQLLSRFSLAEQTQGAVARRVGVLEVSVPTMLEAGQTQQTGVQIDRSIHTAGIGSVESKTFETDGGSVTVSQKPMSAFEGRQGAGLEQPIPSLPAAATVLAPNDKAFGLALGTAVTDANAKAAWQDVSLKMGALLVGLGPLLADDANSSNKRLVVGPLPDMGQAADMCRRMEKVSISCLPVPFTGTPL